MIRRFFPEFLFQTVVAAAVTVTITVLAVIFKYWTWPNAIVGAALMLSAMIYLTDRVGVGPSTKAKVRNWIDESGFAVQTLHDQSEFHFVMTDNTTLRTDIFQVQNSRTITIAVLGLLPSQAQKAVYDAMTPEKKADFWKILRIELIRRDVAYSDLTVEGGGIFVAEEVPITRLLTGSEFLSRVRFVRGAARLYYEIIQDQLGPAMSAAQPNLSSAVQSPPKLPASKAP